MMTTRTMITPRTEPAIIHCRRFDSRRLTVPDTESDSMSLFPSTVNCCRLSSAWLSTPASASLLICLSSMNWLNSRLHCRSLNSSLQSFSLTSSVQSSLGAFSMVAGRRGGDTAVSLAVPASGSVVDLWWWGLYVSEDISKVPSSIFFFSSGRLSGLFWFKVSGCWCCT